MNRNRRFNLLYLRRTNTFDCYNDPFGDNPDKLTSSISKHRNLFISAIYFCIMYPLLPF